MAKPLKKLRGLLASEDYKYADIARMLKSKGAQFYSVGYICNRMTGKENWTTEEMYFFADWLKIPDNELLSYFPRRKQTI